MFYGGGEYPNRLWFCMACMRYWREVPQEDGTILVQPLHYQV